MNRICFFILLFGAVGAGGCRHPQAQSEKVAIEGIKVGDLAAGTDQKMPPQVYFRVFTFDLPLEQVEPLQTIFKGMSRRQIEFASRDAFDANGFLVGFGSQQDWSGLSAELDKLVARRTATRNIVVYEAAGDDLSVSLLNSTEDVTWLDEAGKVVQDTFAVGRFTWTLKARPMESIRGVAHVEIMPAYKIGTQSFLASLAHLPDYTPFSVGTFNVRMSPGDYLLLGSAGEPVGGDGRPIAPLTLNRLLFYPAERPDMMRLILVLCARIED